jgi:deoxyhypusine synthase
MGEVRDFMDRNYRHFNARETVAAARAYEAHLAAGGKMLVSIAGAMSTAEIGITLARMIRAGYVHAISCTGANLEEDVYNLVGQSDYRLVEDWRNLTAEDERAILADGYARVTDTCIPESVILKTEALLIPRWKDACERGIRRSPAEFLFDVLESGDLEDDYRIDPQDSWVLAAMDAGIPVWTPGWEDSTSGNIFAASVIRGDVPSFDCVMHGTEQFADLVEWYLRETAELGDRPSVGFFQIGGGIAGDFAICAVPSILHDLKKPGVPLWGYFAQISDAVTSYGGYSGAPPNEKITWSKLDAGTPSFMIESDASIVAPLVFAYVLGD